MRHFEAPSSTEAWRPRWVHQPGCDAQVCTSASIFSQQPASLKSATLLFQQCGGGTAYLLLTCALSHRRTSTASDQAPDFASAAAVWQAAAAAQVAAQPQQLPAGAWSGSAGLARHLRHAGVRSCWMMPHCSVCCEMHGHLYACDIVPEHLMQAGVHDTATARHGRAPLQRAAQVGFNSGS